MGTKGGIIGSTRSRTQEWMAIELKTQERRLPGMVPALQHGARVQDRPNIIREESKARGWGTITQHCCSC